MAKEQEVFEVAFNESMGFWYIVQNHWKGEVFHQTALAEQYGSTEEAEQAADVMRVAR